MTDDLADLDFESLNADTEFPTAKSEPPGESAAFRTPAAAEPPHAVSSPQEEPATPQSPASRPSQKRPLWEVASILGGVFLGCGAMAWILMTFVFVEEPEAESTLELPRNRVEAVMMELPIGKIRHREFEKNEDSGQATVFIVEIDASIIVKGTASELMEVESLLKSHHHRIEQAIDETIRAASDANLHEPEVLVIRTRIRDRINEFFGRPLVKEVIFGHYRAFRTPIKF